MSLEKDIALEETLKTMGLTAPRLTPGDLLKKIKQVEYVSCIAPSGQVLRWCVMTMENGYAHTGKPSCSASSANDISAIGEKVAYDNAFDDLWSLEGYLLKERMFNEAQCANVISTWNKEMGENPPIQQRWTTEMIARAVRSMDARTLVEVCQELNIKLVSSGGTIMQPSLDVDLHKS